MDEPTLSRRNLIFATGAGLALAACDGAVPTKQPKVGNAAPCGPDPTNGKDPNVGFPQGTFTPSYITLVRISSAGAWDISTNHASFRNTDSDYAQRKALAAEIFNHFKGQQPIKRFADLKSQSNDYHIAEHKHSDGSDSKFDRMDLADFNFGHTHEIYFWFDSNYVTLLRKKTDNKLHLIGMSAQRADGTPTNPNTSFFATDFKSEISIVPQPKIDGPIIVVRNYFLDENDNPLVKEGVDLKYSMNIFYKAKNKKNSEMTMILDPDTGNGVGFDPFMTA